MADEAYDYDAMEQRESEEREEEASAREVEALAEQLHWTWKVWREEHRRVIEPKWASYREDLKERFREIARSLIAAEVEP